MKYIPSLLTAATAATALSGAVVQNPIHQDVISSEELYLLEIEPGLTQWATEEEKWELRRVSLCLALTDIC